MQKSPSPPAKARITLTSREARRLWITAQRLHSPEPFGAGPAAVQAAIEHLGYVQIDTISVIERCHHHILFNRIPSYQIADLAAAQSVEKSVFEYWTHALSYVPVRDFRYFVPAMRANRKESSRWAASSPTPDVRRVLKRIRQEGALTIADIKDDALVDKEHPWGSRKPSKEALQTAFYCGQLVISARSGMLKTYELTERHFGWQTLPAAATQKQYIEYLLNRALTSQGVISLESVKFRHHHVRAALAQLIERRVQGKKLVPITIAGAEKMPHWVEPSMLDGHSTMQAPGLTHILSPFDPLIIQRQRTQLIFGYDHLFEAYLPRERRKFGYFTLPVLVGDEIVAMLDLKTDRQANKLLIQAWHWVDPASADRYKADVEAALHRFEQFQLGR